MSGLTACQQQSTCKVNNNVGIALSLPASHSLPVQSRSNPSFPTTFMHAQPFQELTFPISNPHRMKNQMHDDPQHPVAFMYTTLYDTMDPLVIPVNTCRSSFPTYQNLNPSLSCLQGLSVLASLTGHLHSQARTKTPPQGAVKCCRPAGSIFTYRQAVRST